MLQVLILILLIGGVLATLRFLSGEKDSYNRHDSRFYNDRNNKSGYF